METIINFMLSAGLVILVLFIAAIFAGKSLADRQSKKDKDSD
ncbi:hypothetical protein PN836_018825 [Ningiella sp. W23]